MQISIGNEIILDVGALTFRIDYGLEEVVHGNILDASVINLSKQGGVVHVGVDAALCET